MTKNINLILSSEGKSAKKEKTIKILNIVAIICLGLILSASVILFILNVFTPLDAIKKDQTATINNIALLKEKSAKLTMVNDRLKNISTVMQKRSSNLKLITYVNQEMGPNLKSGSIDLGKKNLTMSVYSTSLLDINEFLQKIVAKAEKKEFMQDLVIQGLTVNEKTGKYSLTFRAQTL